MRVVEEEVLLTLIASLHKQQPDMSQSHKQDIAVGLYSDLSAQKPAPLRV